MKKEKVEELLKKVKAQDDAHPEHNRQKQVYIERLELLIENHNRSLEILRELESLVPSENHWFDVYSRFHYVLEIDGKLIYGKPKL